MTKKRITIFAKGNLDVRDSLHSLTIGGERRWNGLNEVLRDKAPGITARVRHEPFTRSDALLAAGGAAPAALVALRPPLGPFDLETQFSTALFDIDSDVVVLSVQPDIHVTMVRLEDDGTFLHPYAPEGWTREMRSWLRSASTPVPLLNADQSMENFARIIARIRAKRDVPILIYNLSSVVPGDTIYAYDGLDETLSTRIRRFNLGLVELSRRTGCALVDVDLIVARAGADRVKIDPTHLNAEGCRLVAEEVVRILQDLGVADDTETASCAPAS